MRIITTRPAALIGTGMLLDSSSPSRKLEWARDERGPGISAGPRGVSPGPDGAPYPSPAPPPAWRGRVLIVDDEYRIRLALRSCLEAEGYQVDEARDGREAIDAVVGSPPDVMLIDLAMPILDGLSALRLLADLGTGAKPRVIVLTAYGSIAAAEMAHELGAVAFLEKPVMPESLRAAVAMALGGSSD